jgi:hypothetical protein
VKVSELIEALKQFGQDLPVGVVDDYLGWDEVKLVQRDEQDEENRFPRISLLSWEP